jgi:ATP-binding cassette, subfamily B, bacterial
MAQSFDTSDHKASANIHSLFWKANFIDKRDLIIWIVTRPTALLIYHVLIPFQIAYALQAIITRQFTTVNENLIAIVLLGIGYCFFWTIGGVAICKNGQIGLVYLQKKIFNNYLHKDYEFFSTAFIGTLGAQATQLRDAYVQYNTLFMNSVIKQGILIVASIIIIAYQSLLLATVTLVSMFLVMSFTIISSHWRLKYRRILSEASSQTAGIIGDALSHGTAVKSFAAEHYEETRLDRSVSHLGVMQYRSWMTSIPADVGRILLSTIATVVLLILTAQLYMQGSISIAIVVLVQMYVIKLVLTAQEIAETIKTYEAIMSGAHQAVKTMLIPPTVLDHDTVTSLNKKDLTIKINQVSYHYPESPKNSHAVNAITLTIAKGEKIGLVGYSGSGKTTLTKLLLRFMDVTSGSITVGDIDIRDVSQQSLRKHIAYVPQEPLLFHRSIKENIAYGKPKANNQTIQKAGKAAYVDDFIHEMYAGYDTLVGEKGVKLSGGQRQRVAIARAILKDAPILLLDEATSALDSQSEQYIQKALWHLMKNRTAIVIAHRLSTIQRMDRIIVMDHGKIVDIGSHNKLLRNEKGIYAQLWAHQSGGYLGGNDEKE